MVGIALEGGGVRGSYQAGVISAFLECRIKFDGVCGTSIGALNASIIASGEGAKLATIWRSMNMGQVFGFSDEFIKAVNSENFHFNNIETFIKEGFSILLKKGIELEGVKKVIDEYLDVDKLYNSPIDYGLVTVRLKDFKPLYLWKKDMNKEKLRDYIIASSFLPFFRREKLINNEYYLDGGFRDLGPVNMMLEKGYDKVYLIKVHGVGISRKYDKNANVIEINPKRSLGGVMDLNPQQIDENIKMGYYDAIRLLKKLDGINYVFTSKNEKYYRFINRNVSRKLYHRVSHFFKTNNYKDTTIKALEYIMQKEKYNYYEIYKPSKVIKKIQKTTEFNNFILNYIKKLKYFF